MEELLDEKALEEDFQVARRLQELDEELRDLASRRAGSWRSWTPCSRGNGWRCRWNTRGRRDAA